MLFKQQNRESAKLAFPGYIYKTQNQRGSSYINAHVQRAAASQHTHLHKFSDCSIVK